LAPTLDLDATAPVSSPAITETLPIELPDTVAAPRAQGTVTAANPHPPDRSRRAPRVIAAIFGALLVVAVVAGLTVGNDDSPRAPAPTTQPTTVSLPQDLDRAMQQLQDAVGR
jgi:hypothetical protein